MSGGGELRRFSLSFRQRRNHAPSLEQPSRMVSNSTSLKNCPGHPHGAGQFRICNHSESSLKNGPLCPVCRNRRPRSGPVFDHDIPKSFFA